MSFCSNDPCETEAVFVTASGMRLCYCCGTAYNLGQAHPGSLLIKLEDLLDDLDSDEDDYVDSDDEDDDQPDFILGIDDKLYGRTETGSYQLSETSDDIST